LTTTYDRSKRISDLIMQEISNMIVRSEIKDPRVRGVVITDARVTPDLGLAKVYFTTIETDTEARSEALRGLNSARGFITRELWKRFKMKKVPRIEFLFDTVLEEGYKIDELLRSVSDD